MNMTEPTPNEKEKSIDTILSKGLVKPPSIWAYLHSLYRQLGLRYIFWDTSQALILFVIVLAGLFLLMIGGEKRFKYTILFACSPMLYILTMCISETVERFDSLYELKITCKHTPRQITVFRILCFSLAGTIYSVGLTIFFTGSISELLGLLSLSLSALCLCAFVSLFLIRRFMGKLIFCGVALLWLLIGFIPAILFAKEWESFLTGLPVLITASVAVLSGLLFIIELKKIISATHREVIYHAIG